MNNQKVSQKIIKILLLFIIAIAIIILIIMTTRNKTNHGRIGEAFQVENVTITANNIKSYQTDDEEYIQVNLTVINNQNTELNISAFLGEGSNFYLKTKGNKEISSEAYETLFEDQIDTVIEPGATASGNLYFKTKLQNKMKLVYETCTDNARTKCTKNTINLY